MIINQPLPFDLNDSLWTISHEFICYLILLVLGVTGLLRNRIFILCFFVLSYCCMLYFQYFNTEWIYRIFPGNAYQRLIELSWLLAFFMAGTCFYTFRKFLLVPLNWLIIITPFVFLFAARFTNAALSVQLFLGSYVMFCFAFSRKIRLYHSSKYGDFSYGVYLYGWPVQQLIVHYFWPGINFYVSMFLAFFLVLPFAIFSWYAVEKPFLKLKKVNLLPLPYFKQL